MSSPVFYFEPFHAPVHAITSTPAPLTSNGVPAQPLTHFNQWHLNEGISSIRPRMDLHENEENNVVTATFEMPGVHQNDVQLKVQNEKLTVTAEPTLATDHAENDFPIRERRIGKFFRVLQLPSGINEFDIQASVEDGILTVTFPKVAAQALPRKMTIT